MGDLRDLASLPGEKLGRYVQLEGSENWARTAGGCFPILGRCVSGTKNVIVLNRNSDHHSGREQAAVRPWVTRIGYNAFEVIR